MQMAAKTAMWTLAKVHGLPDDGNKYELVRGELFVTPAPSYAHESLASVLRSILDRYVDAQRLGRVFTPRAVVRVRGSEVEPDLMVRSVTKPAPRRWQDAPVPILVVEILSGTTRRRDHVQKRKFYLDVGVQEYWIVDGENRNLRVVRPDKADVVEDVTLVWHPPGATNSVVIDVRAYFLDAIG